MLNFTLLTQNNIVLLICQQYQQTMIVKPNVPSYKSPYEITLTKNTWAYCNELPEISLSNYVLKEGETVDWFYIEKILLKI